VLDRTSHTLNIAQSQPGDLVVDPAVGSFVVLYAMQQVDRQFLGCDIAYTGGAQ